MIAKQGTSAPPEKLRGRAIVCEGPANHFANGLVVSTRDGGNQRFVVHRNAEWVRMLSHLIVPGQGYFSTRSSAARASGTVLRPNPIRKCWPDSGPKTCPGRSITPASFSDDLATKARGVAIHYGRKRNRSGLGFRP